MVYERSDCLQAASTRVMCRCVLLHTLQLVLMRGNLSAITTRLLRYDAPNALRSELPSAEFPTAEATAHVLSTGGYFVKATPGGDTEVCGHREPL